MADARDSWSWVFRSFLVDFVAKVMPGTLFVVFAAVALVPSAYVVVRPDPARGCGSTLTQYAQALAPMADALWLPLTMAFLFLSYAFGHLLCRANIKVPDMRSTSKLFETRGLAEEDAPGEFGCAKPGECQFPYPRMKDYLEQRGLMHLVPLVAWTGNAKLRSKNYINILKIRIGHRDGEIANTIVRNEAHVRLSSAIWHAGSVLRWLGIAGLTLILLVALLHNSIYGSPAATYWPNYVGPALGPLVAVAAAFYFQKHVEDFIHEQRMREIMFVLETAYTMFINQPNELRDVFPYFGKQPPGSGDTVAGDG